jgi:hypothetical protein
MVYDNFSFVTVHWKRGRIHSGKKKGIPQKYLKIIGFQKMGISVAGEVWMVVIFHIKLRGLDTGVSNKTKNIIITLYSKIYLTRLLEKNPF